MTDGEPDGMPEGEPDSNTDGILLGAAEGTQIWRLGSIMVKQYPRSDCSSPESVPSTLSCELRPPSSTLIREVSVTSKDTIAGRDTSGGFAGSAVKSVPTFTACVAIAYRASLSGKIPASNVSVADEATLRLVAPSTASNSYIVPPLIVSPSTS